MFNPGQQLAPGHTVASQLIGHDHPRDKLNVLQQPAKEVLRGFAIPPWLNEDVEHNAVLVHGTPKIMLSALDPDENPIKVTGTRTTAAQAVGQALAEFFTPASNGLVGDDNAPLGQNLLHIPQAEAEHVIEPDSMRDDLGGKAMAVVRVGWRLHAISLAGLQPDCQTRLT
jgi:hypothetical protein